MNYLARLFDTVTTEDILHCFGTGVCLVISKSVPVLAIVALIYQIRIHRARALRAELQLKKECTNGE